MKKVIAIFAALAMVTALSVTAFAAPEVSILPAIDEGQKTEERLPEGGAGRDAGNPPDTAGRDIFSEWEMNGYPDDVGGVYYDNESGKPVVMLVNGSEARRGEIRALAGDIGFGEAKYSYNEMLAVRDEITAQMSEGSGIYSVGVGWATRDNKVLGFGESGKEFRVVVTVDVNALRRYAQDWQAKYGDMVYVTTGDAPMLLEDDAAAVNTPAWQYAIAALFICMAAGAVSIARSRRAALRTTTGHTVTADRPAAGRREVIEAVRQNSITPGDDVYESIMKKLDE